MPDTFIDLLFGGFNLYFQKQSMDLQQDAYDLSVDAFEEQAYELQREATIFGWEERIRAEEYNIERIGIELIAQVGDIKKAGEKFLSTQLAFMGASGATIGIGTPLMNIIETQAGIDTDIRNVTELAELEIEWRTKTKTELEKQVADAEEVEEVIEDPTYTFDPVLPVGGLEKVDSSYPGPGTVFVIDPSLPNLPYKPPPGKEPKKKKKPIPAPGAALVGGIGAGINIPGVTT